MTPSNFLSLLLLALFATFIHSQLQKSHHRRAHKNRLTPLLNVVVTRHGDRTPLTRFQSDKTVWNCSALPAELSQSPIQPTLAERSSSLRYAKYFTRSSLPGTCMQGQLTETGIRQHVELGSRYGRRIGQNVDCRNIKLETTDRPRTIQSMESFMTGFLGTQSQCTSPNLILKVATQETSVGDMHANFAACPVLPEMLVKFSDDQEWKDEHAKYADVFQRVLDAFELPPTTNVELWQIADVLVCRASRGIAPPPGMTEDDVEAINTIYIWEYEYTNRHKKYLQLSIGTFLDRMLEEMDATTRSNDTMVPFHLYSGHDTTLAPLLGTLGIELNMDTWPIYASNIHFQVLSDGNQRYIGVEYMEKPIRVKGCADVICTWDEFVQTVSPYLISFSDWQHECHVGRTRGLGAHLKDRAKK